MPHFHSYWTQEFATRNCPYLTRQFSQRIGAIIAWSGERIGLSPNALTLLGLIPTALACTAFAIVPTTGPLIALVLFQLAYGIDCADGQLARATSQQSNFGAWLDIAVDHGRNVMITIAMMHFLILSNIPIQLTSLVVAIFGMGATISLHAFSFIKSTDEKTKPNSDSKDQIRYAVKAFTDTPLIMLLICVLAYAPAMLAVYLFLMGVMNILTTIYLAQNRIRPHSHESA